MSFDKFQGVSKRIETQDRDIRGNNIYLRAGKRAASLYPHNMASPSSNLEATSSMITCSKFGCYQQSPLRVREIKYNYPWSNGQSKYIRFLSQKGKGNGASRWNWAPDFAIFNRENWRE